VHRSERGRDRRLLDLDALQTGSGITFNDATDELTVPRTGTYLISASALWSPNTTGSRSLSIGVNGTSVGVSDQRNGTTGGATINNVSAPRRLVAGDKLSLSALQSSGGPLATFVVGGSGVILSAAWLGP
jgi:hypothetical protein